MLQQCTPVTMCMNVNGICTLPPQRFVSYVVKRTLHMWTARSVQGRLEQVLSTEICMKVVECVQIVCKMQVNILHPAFGTIFCLLLVGLLELNSGEESVALWTQTNKLLHRHRIQFVLEESGCLAIHSTIEGMVEVVLTEIIVSCNILFHISINIFCLNSIGQTIRVREQQLQLIMVGYFTHM